MAAWRGVLGERGRTDVTPLDESYTGRVARTRQVLHIPDQEQEPGLSETMRERLRLAGGVSLFYAPILAEDRVLGSIGVMRSPPRPFTEKELALAQIFADQAAIAVQNARLFAEVQAKTRDLEESLAQQTATADVLKVISRSAFDLDAIFQTLVATAVDLCQASSGALCVREGDVFRYRGMAGPDSSPDLQRYLTAHPIAAPDRQTIAGRTILSRTVEHIPDVASDSAYAVPLGAHGNPARALLGVPLLGKNQVEGALALTRKEPGEFPARQIEMLQTFADQAVIAIENARLFSEVQARTQELQQSLDDLRKAQDRLIQSEKLASLRQLTAGIAHEIKNPLNFINNFSALSRELMDELREVLVKAPLQETNREEAHDLIGMIDANLDKVVAHGRRADSIVKNMLLHAREGSGERGSVNVNAMVEEALNLAYHGARAEKRGFNVTIEKALDPAAGEAELYLQELTRVLLNLISNAFYATTKRKESQANAGYEPTIFASTRDLGHSVEIVIRDNGVGIADDVKAKMFNPFFTTKPAGEGTGLGLSLSHDIVVKQHGGTIEVATEPGAFTAFTITLPRTGTGS
jgi:signal transduction histidine kinase